MAGIRASMKGRRERPPPTAPEFRLTPTLISQLIVTSHSSPMLREMDSSGGVPPTFSLLLLYPPFPLFPSLLYSLGYIINIRYNYKSMKMKETVGSL